MLLGLLEPTRGSSIILGCDALRSLLKLAPIGYMAEGHPVYGWMRVGEYSGFQRGFYDHWNQEIFAAVIDYFAINRAPRPATCRTVSAPASTWP